MKVRVLDFLCHVLHITITKHTGDKPSVNFEKTTVSLTKKKSVDLAAAYTNLLSVVIVLNKKDDELWFETTHQKICDELYAVIEYLMRNLKSRAMEVVVRYTYPTKRTPKKIYHITLYNHSYA